MHLLLILVAAIASMIALWPLQAVAQQACDVEGAQRLFGQQPRPTAEVRTMLADCQKAGSTDYRVYMFLGVMAREAGNSEQAIEYLRKAVALDRTAVNPALELAFTLEAHHAGESAEVYASILKRDSKSRPAMLGLARVARSQNRLDDARAQYERLLQANPKDPEALNGMAWLALADRDREKGRAGFETVLALDPGNEEAKIGLARTRDVYRYLFDATGMLVSTAQGSSGGFGARGMAGVTAFDTLELGWQHYTNELQTVSAIGLATLPSNDIMVGYHRLVPLSYAFSLVYDYRGHTALPTEHWIDGSATLYIADWLRAFAGYRQAFGAFQYNGRLIRGGLSATVADGWDVSGTVYNSEQAIFNNYQPLWSWVAEVTYHGPRNLLVVAGVGYSPLIDNVDIHGRAILPVTDRIALQLIAAHNSINADTRLTAGLRLTW